MTSTFGSVSELSSTSQLPSGPGRTNTSGTTGCTRVEPEPDARARVEPVDFPDHVDEVFVVDAAAAAQRHEVALGEQIQARDQRLHGGIELVALPELDREAFGEVARADAGRTEGSAAARGRLPLFAAGVPSLSATSARSPTR